MSIQNLGETFDIHGGGLDLRFPHHENELAQSEAATGKTFVNYWMHVGALQIDKQKMSKSLGNIANIKDFLEDYHQEVLRYFSISSHYRSPVDFSSDQIALSFQALERFYLALRGLEIDKNKAPLDTVYEKEFQAAMSDDFNTPVAMAVLFDLAREINQLRTKDIEKASQLAGLLVKLGNILGFLSVEPEEFLRHKVPLTVNVIEDRIIEREVAKKNKDWAKADKIRDKLLSQGILIEDTPTGTTWRIAGGSHRGFV
jgi:cysteinyl-tRNA synthetase